MDTIILKEIYLIIGVLIFISLFLVLFFSKNEVTKEIISKNSTENIPTKDSIEDIGQKNSISLNLAYTYFEMGQNDKAQDLLSKLNQSTFSEEEKDLFKNLKKKVD